MFCNKSKIKWDSHDELRECVKSFVNEKRYVHTLGVEEEAVKLADIFGCGDKGGFIKKLRSAALLHDITKEFAREKQLEICKKYKIKLSKDDIKTEKEWHAKTGAYIAEHEFGADDIIFSGIYNHTFGGTYSSFTLFDKIIYLADYIEKNRTYQDCAEVRGFFYSGIVSAENPDEKRRVLDETILISMDKTLNALINENLFIHKNTVKNRNSFIIQLKNSDNFKKED